MPSAVQGTARSPRTRKEHELVRFDEKATRVVVHCSDGERTHELSVGFMPGESGHVLELPQGLGSGLVRVTGLKMKK